MRAARRVSDEVARTNRDPRPADLHLRVAGEDEVVLLLVVGVPMASDRGARWDHGHVDEVDPTLDGRRVGDALEADRPLTTVRDRTPEVEIEHVDEAHRLRSRRHRIPPWIADEGTTGRHDRW